MAADDDSHSRNQTHEIGRFLRVSAKKALEVTAVVEDVQAIMDHASMKGKLTIMNPTNLRTIAYMMCGTS